MFDRTVDAQELKINNSKGTVRAFLTVITEKNREKKNLVDNGTDFAGEFQKVCKAGRREIYYTRSDTNATVFEHTLQSFKTILYCYMENEGCLPYNHNVSFRQNFEFQMHFLDRLDTSKFQKFRFLSVLYRDPQKK